MRERIIDAHLHFADHSYFDEIAKAAKHENSAAHLAAEYENLGIEAGIVMGNFPVSEEPDFPAFLFYCVGIDREEMAESNWKNTLFYVEQHLKKGKCVGVKLYPGYNHFYAYEDFLAPLYKLAVSYNKPVAVHTGLTAGQNAFLKYCHPLTLDEAATKFPDVNFVMCHFGEPWFLDAVAVMEKNPNVSADLSGMLEGKIPNLEEFFAKKRRYMGNLRDNLLQLDSFCRLLFGTDWPLANLSDYIAFTKNVIPAEEQYKVFYQNAKDIYRLPV